MAKCDPRDVDVVNDVDCSGEAFFFSYDVVVVATLNDAVETSNSDLTF